MALANLPKEKSRKLKENKETQRKMSRVGPFCNKTTCMFLEIMESYESKINTGEFTGIRH